MNAPLTIGNPQLLGLGTPMPPHRLPQDLAHLNAKRILGDRYPDVERLTKSFEDAGIVKPLFGGAV
ncbi:MAG: hypothetical protein MO846_11730 [Candidatus Devosia symbiotica]|nr:hypothetical protein [Candidatus Devosia symbiotica]